MLRGATRDYRKYSKRQAKYHNEKVLVDGILFDSKKEADKYAELQMLKRAGVVTEIDLQPKFLLQAGYRDYHTKRWVRPIIYVADFRVAYADGRVEVDTKGFRTKEYRLKLKLFRQKYPDIVFVEE
ncbi:MAG: DUF1064 domain-containing protein [Veillonellales bacterium]